MELCKHLQRIVERDQDGARYSCPECRLLARVLKGGEIKVEPMKSLVRVVGRR